MREKNIPGQKDELMQRSSGRNEFAPMKKREAKQMAGSPWVRKGGVRRGWEWWKRRVMRTKIYNYVYVRIYRFPTVDKLPKKWKYCNLWVSQWIQSLLISNKMLSSIYISILYPTVYTSLSMFSLYRVYICIYLHPWTRHKIPDIECLTA